MNTVASKHSPIRLIAAFSFCAVTAFGTRSFTQVITDGSVGPQVSLSGPDIRVGETLGSTVGRNLFHSFRDFRISSNQRVTFTGSDNITNVISRVTGNAPTMIEGALVSEVSNANFYFVNPNGVTFSRGASLDVPASLHFGAVSSIGFSDGFVYLAAGNAGVLTIASPESFGFGSGDINFDRVLLNVSNNDSVTIAGSHVEFQGEIDSPASIVSGDGVVRIVAMGNENKHLPLHTEIVDNYHGDLILNNAIVTSRIGGGEITLIAGDATFTGERSEVSAINGTGDLQGTAVIVNAQNLLLSDGANVFSDSNSAGAAGNVSINIANQLSIVGGANTGAGIQSDTQGSGNGGNVQVRASAITIEDSGAVIRATTFNAGMGGNVVIDAESIFVNGDGASASVGIFSESQSAATGAAGNIQISAEDVTVMNGGQISTSSRSASEDSGPAGNIVLNVENQLILNGMGSNNQIFVTGITSNAGGSGVGGAIQISAGSVVIDDTGEISTQALSNDAGPIAVESEQFFIRDGSITTSSLDESSDGGNLSLTADVLILDGAFIQANAGNEGGDIDIQTGVIIPDGGRLLVNGDDVLLFSPGSESAIQAIGDINGDINVVAPDIDISALVSNLGAEVIAEDKILSDPCSAFVADKQSSLIRAGRGSLPISAHANRHGGGHYSSGCDVAYRTKVRP